MSMSLVRAGATVRATLSGELTVDDVAEMHRALGDVLDGETSLVIDAAEVARLDVAAAQLVVATSHRVGVCRVEAASPAWSYAWSLLGLDKLGAPTEGGALP